MAPLILPLALTPNKFFHLYPHLCLPNNSHGQFFHRDLRTAPTFLDKQYKGTSNPLTLTLPACSSVLMSFCFTVSHKMPLYLIPSPFLNSWGKGITCVRIQILPGKIRDHLPWSSPHPYNSLHTPLQKTGYQHFSFTHHKTRSPFLPGAL